MPGTRGAKQLYINTEVIRLEFTISCFTQATYLKSLIGPSYHMNNIFLTGEAFIFKAPQRKVSVWASLVASP